MDQQLADEIADMLSTADSADVGSTVRVGIPCLAQMLEKNARLMDRARQAELALATEREQHSRLKEQWEIMSQELASTRTDRQRVMFDLAKVREELEQTQAKAVASTSSLDDYQHAAMRTTIHERGAADMKALSWNALGIAGEAGEVADLIKKHVAHGHELDEAKLTRELGDVLWYVAALAHDIGVSLSTVAHENVEKLKARYPDGFDRERSKNRVAE